MQLSTSNNIISTPWGQQLYMSMLMHRGEGGERGVAYIWRGDLTEGFLHYEFRGLIIHEGDCLRNFTVVL